MKKLLALLVALIAVTTAATNASAQLTVKDTEELDISIEFVNAGNGTIALYTAETGGSLISSLVDLENETGAITAPLDERKLIKEMWLEIVPAGIYEVHVYTNNLDTDDDGLNDGELDLTAIGGNAGTTAIHTIPANLSSLTPTAQSNFVAQYAGIWHELSAFPADNDDTTNVVFVLPVKVRSEGELGLKVNELPDPDNDALTFVELTGTTISDLAFSGGTTAGLNEVDATFSFIPEQEAIAVDDVGNDLGNFRKKVASTALATNFTKRQQLLLGVDLLAAGKGDYSGTIYLEMQEN